MKQVDWARAHFDSWTDYDAYLASFRWRVPAQLADAVMPHLQPHCNVLDVGCGTGLLGEELRKRGFGGRIMGFDAAEKRLAETRAKSHGGRKVYDLTRAGDAYALPWQYGTFDAVVSCGMLGLTGHRTLVQMLGALREGGILGVTVVRSIRRREFAGRYAKVLQTLDAFAGSRLLEALERRELDDPYDGDRDGELHRLFVGRLNRPYRERR